jgi:NTE family protein
MHDRINSTYMASLLASVGAFGSLSATELTELANKLEFVSVARGDLLIREGEQADALYLVLSGRFQVFRGERGEPLAEVGVGQPIGEIAFLAGGRRTASVRAERDCLVVRLGRLDFEELAARSADLWARIACALAGRLREVRREQPARRTLPRTIAICRAGLGPMPREFTGNLRRVLEERSPAILLDGATLPAGQPLESAEGTSWFNELEARHDHVLYLADAELTPWSRKCLRQADLVLGVAGPGADGEQAQPNELERYAAAHRDSEEHRLVLLHERHGTITGTRHWLELRPHVRMHHHVARGELDDYRRLARFIDGTAIGLVACGGGAFTSAHLGLYQALREAGITFDIMGGSSGGAALAAAFATGTGIDEIEHGIHEIFVKARALRRWTWPRYSLLDHTAFDRALARHYGEIDIEDLWIPYFAVSTNLTTNELFYHRHGRLWEAVRATGAIPALLPPFFTAQGDVLVDGSLLDNVPAAAMRSFKAGPNVVISFEVTGRPRVDVNYAALPSRRRLMWCAVSPQARRRLPGAPGPLSVLMRSLMVSRRKSELAVEPGDLVLSPRIAAELGFMNWQHHSLLRQQAYDYSVAELARLKIAGHPLLNA